MKRWEFLAGTIAAALVSDCRRIEAAGFLAVMPLWGERLA